MQTQQATLQFFAPVAVAYLAACAAWFGLERIQPQSVRQPATPETNRPRLDFVLCILAIAGVLGIGQIYRAGWLLPAGESPAGRLNWTIDNLLIYSPIAVVLAARRQGLETVYLSARHIAKNILIGIAIGLLAVACYLALRGGLPQFRSVIIEAVSASSLANFTPVFLEGVAMAFGFVRLRWAFGQAAALFIPGVLFALAHVPRGIAEGRTPMEIAAFFLFNVALVPAILYTISRSRDIVWIGMVHYLMDIATGAFAR
jgi:hypothetical protein